MSSQNAPPLKLPLSKAATTSISVLTGNFNAPISAQTTNEYQAVREWRTEYGRFLADTDMDAWTKVCVIGSKIWKEQFKGQDPIGKEVVINNFGNNKRFTVIGIMESRRRRVRTRQKR